ncbi:MAG: isochorismatase family protein [Opitutales bacterium]
MDETRHLGLLVLDLQQPFLQAVVNNEALLQRCLFAAQAAGLLKIPVFATEQVPDKLGRSKDALRNLEPAPAFFAKTTFSAFGSEALVQALRTEDIQHLLVCGLETPICVYQTVLAARQHDFEVTVLSDCVSARRREDQAQILTALHHAGIPCLPAETIFYSLLRDAQHPAFRDFSNLVKHAHAQSRSHD